MKYDFDNKNYIESIEYLIKNSEMTEGQTALLVELLNAVYAKGLVDQAKKDCEVLSI